MRIKSLSLLFVFCLTGFSYITAQEPNRGAGVVSVTVQDGNKSNEIKFYDGSYALVIGISNYTNGWNVLPGVKEDVEEVKKALEKHDFKVETAMDLNSKDLKERIENFINDYGKDTKNIDSRLVIYFAGHGFTQTTPDGRQIGYIIPADCPLSERNPREFNIKAIPMNNIDTWANNIFSKHALFVFDSCFSGLLIERSDISYPSEITERLKSPVRQFITSGTANQTVPDKSVFRQKFVLGLDGEADLNSDGFITASEFAAYLKDQVRRTTNSMGNNQTPQYTVSQNFNLRDGDMVFKSEKTRDPNRKNVSSLENSGKSEITKQSPIIKNLLELKTREFTAISVVDRNGIRKSAKSYDENLGNLKLEMIEIPEGKFQMGSKVSPQEQPIHEVTLKKFYMSIFEITQAQWRAVARMNRVNIELETSPSDNVGDDLPVENVTWEMAVEFCKRLSQYTGREYTLPTEAEWEYAARANTTTEFGYGPTIDTQIANYDGRVSTIYSVLGTFRGKTIPVGSLKNANGFGLYDMYGNVAEWCLDTEHRSYKDAPTDGNSPWIGGESNNRIVRGGSWGINASSLRSAYRTKYPENERNNKIGFRIVMRSKLQ